MENTLETENKTSAAKKQAPQLQSLAKLEGAWRIEGKNFSPAPEGGESEVAGQMTNTWLPGNFFLKTEWSYQFGKDQHIGSGAMGFDENTNRLFVRNFDNMGYDRLYEIDIYKNTWNYKGENERATLVFNDAGDGYEENWELKIDGAWKPLCNRKGKKQ